MPKTTTAIDFFQQAPRQARQPLYVIFGDDAYLKREVLKSLREILLEDQDAEFAYAEFTGNNIAPRDLFDELATVGLFGGPLRVVVVREADDFVTAHRGLLEDYAAKPVPHGVLVLETRRWPGNTRLAKAVNKVGQAVDCKPPKAAQLVRWLITRSGRNGGARLSQDAAEALLEMVGPELGLLEQELARLRLEIGEQTPLTADLIRRRAGSWRTRTTWEMLDTALAGDGSGALAQLDRLLTAGEHPVGLMAQVGSSLRRFATATRLVELQERQGTRGSLAKALSQAGVPPFLLRKSEAQLRLLGRQRGGQLHRWLLATDLALKGSSSAPLQARVELETLLVQLSRPTATR